MRADAFIAVAYHLAHEPDVELTLFHGPFAHGNDETISRFWKGGYRKVEDYADPFAGQGGSGLVWSVSGAPRVGAGADREIDTRETMPADTVVVASSQLSESLKAATPALARHPKLRLVLLVPDAAAFDPLAPSTGPPAPALPAAQLQAALSLARARRLRFLVPSSLAQRQLAAHLALMDGSRATEWLGRTGRVERFFAYVPTPRVARRYDVNRFKSWAKVGVLVPPAYHTGSGHGNGNGTDAPGQAVARLLEEVQQAVQAAPASWGYRTEQASGGTSFVRASTRDARPLEVHFFSLQSAESLRFAGIDVRVPNALRGIVRVHGGLDAQGYHRLVSTMDVLVPVDSGSQSPRSQTLALSARVPVLLPESAASASQLSRPALIAYPDEMPVMRALQSVRGSRDPRGKMGESASL